MRRRFALPLSRVLVSTLAAAALFTQARSARATDPDRVEWSADWPRVRLVEVVDVMAVTLGSYAIESRWTPPRNASWRGGILFDDTVRDVLKARTYEGQERATMISDRLYQLGIFAPYLIDVFVVGLGVHQNADVALQMLLINIQSLGITGVVSLVAEHAVGRTRPYVHDCGADGVVRGADGHPLFNSCSGDRDYQSFFSGHTSSTATMAGLTCVHHQHLPLYGGGIRDLAPCIVMIGASVTTGLARIAGDHHWASDVMLGWGVGALSGYVLPSILHYGFNAGRPLGQMDIAGAHVLPVPQIYAGGAGFALAGSY